MNGERLPSGAYREKLDIAFRDMDCDQHVRLSVWLAWLAELAGDDYEERGFGRDELISHGQVFLVNHFSLRVRRAPVCYETLLATTWEYRTDRIFFERNYAVETPAGETIAEARSAWLLCDPVGHRILRPRALFNEPRFVDRDVDCPPMTPVTLPEGLHDLGQRKVVYTDLDANRHVYCANYGRIIADYLPAALAGQAISGLDITYAKEAQLGETLHILGTVTDDGYVMVGRHPDGNDCFIAKIS